MVFAYLHCLVVRITVAIMAGMPVQPSKPSSFGGVQVCIVIFSLLRPIDAVIHATGTEGDERHIKTGMIEEIPFKIEPFMNGHAPEIFSQPFAPPARKSHFH